MVYVAVKSMTGESAPTKKSPASKTNEIQRQAPPPSPPAQPNQGNTTNKRRKSSPVVSRMSLKNAMYVAMDLETTGLSTNKCHITEIAGEILAPSVILIEDGSYTSLVRPPLTIPSSISDLTGITQFTFNSMINSF